MGHSFGQQILFWSTDLEALSKITLPIYQNQL